MATDVYTRWRAAVDAELAKFPGNPTSQQKQKALANASKNNPGLRAEYVEQYNADHPPARDRTA